MSRQPANDVNRRPPRPPAAPPPRAEVRPITEARLQTTVLAAAAAYGWECAYHTHDSRRSQKGFPDLVLARRPRPGKPGRVLFVELKSATGRVSPEQFLWLDVLGAAGAEVHLWRPEQMTDGTILEVLK